MEQSPGEGERWRHHVWGCVRTEGAVPAVEGGGALRGSWETVCPRAPAGGVGGREAINEQARHSDA